MNETDENAVNAVNAVKRSKPSPPRTASSLKHLAGYADTARPGGLAFGDDHEPVKNPESVFAVDDAIESVKSAETCAGCEDPTCTVKATYGANNSQAKPRRCRRHKKDTDIAVTCSHRVCDQNPARTPIERSGRRTRDLFMARADDENANGVRIRPRDGEVYVRKPGGVRHR